MKTLKKLIGVVTSTGMDRTAVVAVPRLKLHSLTRKIMNHITKYFCHDHHEVCGVGDKVHIKACKQLSKKKHWTVIDIVARHPQLDGEPFPQAKLRLPLEAYARLASAQPAPAGEGGRAPAAAAAAAAASSAQLR